MRWLVYFLEASFTIQNTIQKTFPSFWPSLGIRRSFSIGTHIGTASFVSACTFNSQTTSQTTSITLRVPKEHLDWSTLRVIANVFSALRETLTNVFSTGRGFEKLRSVVRGSVLVDLWRQTWSKKYSTSDSLEVFSGQISRELRISKKTKLFGFLGRKMWDSPYFNNAEKFSCL